MNRLFCYWGCKQKVVPQIWERLGDVGCFVDPFCGSMSILLGRPETHKPRLETVGDLDCYVSHFLRALKADPEAVAHHAFYPVSEVDLLARNELLGKNRNLVFQNMHSDADWFNAKWAGWWCWGQTLFVGRNWCNPGSKPTSSMPWTKAIQGHRLKTEKELVQYFAEVAERLKNVMIICGDWSDTLRRGTMAAQKKTVGVVLDCPYTWKSGRTRQLYVCDSDDIGFACRDWAELMGSNPRYRIALFGLHGEYNLPGWECVAWSNSAGRKNRHKERIYFSPGCLKPPQSKSA